MALTTFVSGQVLAAQQLNDSFAAVGGLRLVKAQTIGSAVSSVTVTDAFSSTYENYKIVVSGGTSSSPTSYLLIQFGAVATGYYVGGIQVNTGGSVAGASQNNATSGRVGMTTADALAVSIDVIGPNLAKKTVWGSMGTSDANAASAIGYWYAGSENGTTQHTAFTLLPGGGTLTGGTIRVYGYANTN